MEADTEMQLGLGHVKQMKEKLDIAAKRLQKLTEENQKNAAKLENLNGKKVSLESDLSRLNSLESTLNVEVNPALLQQLDAPFNFELKTGAEFREKMVTLRTLMHQLLLCTSLNEQTAHREQEEQEREYSTKVHDAIRARNLLVAELTKRQKKAEVAMDERRRQYEIIVGLEEKLASCQAETWLASTDKNRMSDHLSLLSKELVAKPCQSTRKPHGGHLRSLPHTSSDVSVVSLHDTHVETEVLTSSNAVQNAEQVIAPNIMLAIQQALRDATGLDCEF